MPAGLDLRAAVEAADQPGEPAFQAVVRVRPGAALELRQAAPPGPEPDTVVLTDRDSGRVADRVVEFGADAQPVDSPELAARGPPPAAGRACRPCRGARRDRRRRTGCRGCSRWFPYLRTHQGAELAEVAAVFGVDIRQTQRRPQPALGVRPARGGPGDLLDFAFEGDTVSVVEAQTLDRPLKLTADEALALRVAARALADVPGLAERDALESAQAKLAFASGALPESAGRCGAARCRSPSSRRRKLWPSCAARWTTSTSSSCVSGRLA